MSSSSDDAPTVVLGDGSQLWLMPGADPEAELVRLDALSKEASEAGGVLSSRHCGNLHRPGDKPAAIWSRGDTEWCVSGVRHRDPGDDPGDDRPSAIMKDGSREWCVNGKVHRLGGPAQIMADGSRTWHRDGKIHRDPGPGPAHMSASGDQVWFRDGRIHRDGDQPAVVLADGTRRWYTDGRLHRENGQPAILSDSGPKWAINGTLFNEPNSHYQEAERLHKIQSGLSEE